MTDAVAAAPARFLRLPGLDGMAKPRIPAIAAARTTAAGELRCS